MKIAMIATEKLPVPALRGGAIQIYIEGVAKLLARKHKVTVFSVRDRRLKRKQKMNGVRYVRLSGKNTRRGYLRALKRALRRYGPFHVLHVFNRPDFVGPLRRASPRSRVVLSIHNEMFSRRKLPRRYAVAAVRHSSVIVAVSRYIARTIRKRVRGARRKVRTVYSGVDPEKFRPRYEIPDEEKEELKAKLGLAGRRVVLAVGRLSPVKGFHVIVRAMRRVRREVPDAALLIIGSSWFGTNRSTPYTRKLRRMARSLRKRVVFTGFVRPRDIPKYFGIADVFVCGSQWREPLARVHYEAMAAAVPIVTTRRGGNPEVVRGTGCGLIVKRYKSAKAMARLIVQVLSDPQAAEEMGRRGRQLVEERYNWQRLCDDLLAIYRKARKRRLPPARGLPSGLPMRLLRPRPSWSRRHRGRMRTRLSWPGRTARRTMRTIRHRFLASRRHIRAAKRSRRAAS
ncbi:MAG: glycosyltransferase family 4 protein [Firmicutes bacterium]|nr:glycosyltransferase family 4 protein [Bacillota bacterium]